MKKGSFSTSALKFQWVAEWVLAAFGGSGYFVKRSRKSIHLSCLFAPRPEPIRQSPREPSSGHHEGIRAGETGKNVGRSVRRAPGLQPARPVASPGRLLVLCLASIDVGRHGRSRRSTGLGHGLDSSGRAIASGRPASAHTLLRPIVFGLAGLADSRVGFSDQVRRVVGLPRPAPVAPGDRLGSVPHSLPRPPPDPSRRVHLPPSATARRTSHRLTTSPVATAAPGSGAP
jgi:hypothetical protein